MPDNNHQRSFPRLPVKIRVDLTSDDSVQPVFSMNMSAGGMFIATHTPISEGKMVILQLIFPNLETPVEVLGEVVWTNRHPSGHDNFPEGMGIKFLNMNSLITDYIGNFGSASGLAHA